MQAVLDGVHRNIKQDDLMLHGVGDGLGHKRHRNDRGHHSQSLFPALPTPGKELHLPERKLTQSATIKSTAVPYIVAISHLI
jgi:hypothetical protein